MCERRTMSASGFTLIEIAIVLLILALIATTIGSVSVGALEARRRTDTTQNMQKVEDALVSFVSSTRRLPCPADGSLVSTDPNWGLEQGALGTCNAIAITKGVIPWRSLGLTPADVVDGWQGFFTYRVPLHLTIAEGMSMAGCDPAGTNVTVSPASPNHLCVAGCVGTMLATCTMPSVFLANKGFQIRNVAGTVLANPAAVPPTGAAYVLISAGPTLGPAYNSNSALVPSSTTLGTEEAKNGNNLAIQPYYVDDDLNVNATAAHFDDIVRRPSVATIIGKANLGPRAH